jgi:hypothetical protein
VLHPDTMADTVGGDAVTIENIWQAAAGEASQF